MPITCIVFDYGGVLAWPPTTDSGTRVASILGMPLDLFRSRYYAERAAYDHDTLDDREYWRRIASGFAAAEDDNLISRMQRIDVEIWSEPNPATVGWIPALRAAGRRTAVLSNMPASFCAALEERDRWLASIDVRIYSGLVRMSKPDHAIYRHALALLDCDPSDALFLDDLPANVEAAREIGMNAEVYSVFSGGLRDIAARYGLPEPDEPSVSPHRLEDMLFAPHRNVGLNTNGNP